ncbi:MAG: PAAR-like domain-containing protein [Gammaproteobacteria bacterium]
MSQVYKNGILYINDEPVIHEGSTGYAEMIQYSWVTVGGERVIQPFLSRVYAKDLKNLSSKLKVNGYRVATMDSYFEKSYGDELSDGGVISGTKGGKAHFTTGSPTVSVDGVPVVRRGDFIICNNGNSQVGPWIEEVPGALSFQSKLNSTPLKESEPVQKLRVAIGVNPSVSDPNDPTVLPFERGLLVTSTDGMMKRYRHTAGVTAEKGFLVYEFDVNEGASFEIKECLNDPYGGLYEVHQGRANIKSSNTPGDIALVAMDIKIYRTTAFDVRDVTSMHLTSWLYLFKDGYVWREFQHWQRHKNLCEVNLIEHAGKDVRPTQLMIGRGVLLTVQDQSGGHEYGYAVSSVQWDWKTIESLGGTTPGTKSPQVQALQQKRVMRFYPEALFGTEPTIDPKTYTCPKGVAWAVYPKEPVPEKIHPKEAFYQKTHPHVGTIYVKDPLGNALYEAKMISKLYNAHLTFLDQNEDLYKSVSLVGSVLDALESQGKNYREYVREEERLKHAPMFEETVKKYEEAIKERVIRLKGFLKQAIEMHVLDDYTDAQLYRSIQYWGYLGFGLNQTKEGRDYFGAILMDENSALSATMAKHEKTILDGTWRAIMLDLADQLCIAAAEQVGGPEKITQWMNEVFPELPKLEHIEIPITALMAEEKLKSRELMLVPHTSVYEFKPDGKVECIMHDSGPRRRMFEEQYSMERNNRLDSRYHRLGNADVKVLQWNGQYIQRVALDIKYGTTIARAFTALSIMNTRYIYKQIEDRKLELCSEEWLWIHGELLASVLEIFAYFPNVNGKTLHQLMEHQWAKPIKGAGAIISKVGPIASVFGFILNMKGYLDSNKSGENELKGGYAIGAFSGLMVGLIFLSRLFKVANLLPIGHLKLIGIVSGIVGFCIVTYFTKNDWESWLFNSPWGKSDVLTRSYQAHLEALFKILRMVHLIEVRCKDNELSMLIPSYDLKVDPDSVYLERPLNKMLHDQLKNTPIVLVFKVQQVTGGILTVMLSSTNGSQDTEIPIPCMSYGTYYDENGGIVQFDVTVPVNYLPRNGSGLQAKIEYYLSTPGKEQMPLLESYEYEVVYDPDEYKYRALLISEKKNKQDDLYENW